MGKTVFPKNPVLFITYNRLDLVKETFSKIKEYKPERFYIASDGGKNPEDMEKVREVRAYLDSAVDWECEVKTRYAASNQGCKYGPYHAMEWFFGQEEQGIILEDDVRPERDFWRYMDEMLERFQKEEQVMLVSGCNIMTEYRSNTRFFFTRHPNYWGWGTWKRAWKYMDIDMKQYPKMKESKILSSIFAKNTAFSLERDFEEVYSGELDAWDYAFTMAVILKNGLAVMPAQSLTLNEGFARADGTHTNSNFLDIQAGSLLKDLPDPEKIEADKNFDELVDRDFFRVNYFHEWVRMVLPQSMYKRILILYRKLRTP